MKAITPSILFLLEKTTAREMFRIIETDGFEVQFTYCLLHLRILI